MDEKIKVLIEEAIQELKILRQEQSTLFANIPPVLWFGNIEEKDKDKILVISANPNHPDKPLNKPRISSFKNLGNRKINVEELYNDYNGYFCNNPATGWFGKNNVLDRQGRIEQFLNGLDASFYDGNYKYQAIHIDLLPFSTKGSFTKIADELLQIPNITALIDKHVRDLIEIIKPKIVIINGVSNFKYFNLCVNIGVQPYQISKYKNTTIWISSKSPERPIIIGISMNMGSSCRMNRENICNLGRKVKQFINGE